MRFESYVILNTAKTVNIISVVYRVFESYVILNTAKTSPSSSYSILAFESYVILNTAKTNVTNKTKLFGKPYQYSNVFGRIETCDIAFSLTANNTNSNSYNYPNSAGINPLGQLIQINNLQLEKDSREIINIAYQLHFVTDNNNIVIGQALADNNSFIGANTNVPAKVVFLDKKIGTFETVLDFNTAIYIDWEEQLNGDGEKKYIDFGSFYAPVSCQAWAILDSKNNLMIGMNEVLNQGERTTAIIANFTRNR